MALFRRRPPTPAAPPAEPAGLLEERNRETGRMLAYHERTKHSYATVMKSGWSLDWDNQPNPFRRYDGAPRLVLPEARLAPALLGLWLEYEAQQTPESHWVKVLDRLMPFIVNIDPAA